MGRKYIIELEDNESVYKTIIANEYPMIQVIVPAPYTEPDLEQVRKEAYAEGRKVGIKDGECEAWEAARKIGRNSMCSLEEIGFDFSQCVFPDYNPSWFVVKNYSASECIEKIRQYEQEKEKQIQVGDEVIRHYKSEFAEGDDAPSIFLSEEDGYFRCLAFNGRSIMIAEYPKNQYRKTGRHFPEISEVLQKMKES